MNTTTPLFLAITAELPPQSSLPESSGQLIVGVVIGLFVLVVGIFFIWLLGPAPTADRVEKGSHARIKMIKSEFLKLSLRLDQNHAIEQRMAELEEEYRRLQTGGPFRALSLKDELEKNKAFRLMKELEENGPPP